jgi:hypothetical protein
VFAERYPEMRCEILADLDPPVPGAVRFFLVGSAEYWFICFVMRQRQPIIGQRLIDVVLDPVA